MFPRLISSCSAIVCLLLAVACGSTSVTQSTAPDSVRCQASLGTVPTLAAAGGGVAVPVVTERECAWTVASSSTWIQIAPASGQGEGLVTVTTTANPQGTARSGNIAVNGSQVAVTQAASPCTFSLNPADVTMPAAGGTTGTQVTTLTGCTWTATSTEPWAAVKTGSGSGPSQVVVSLDANDSTTSRGLSVLIAGRNLTITQGGRPAPSDAPIPSAPDPSATPAPAATPTPTPAPTATPTPTPTPTPPAPVPTPPPAPVPTPIPRCTFSIDPLTRSVKDKGGDETVRVITASGCSWTAKSNVSWITVKGDSEGTGTKDVKYDVDRNRSKLARTGTLSIAGFLHVIVQEP